MNGGKQLEPKWQSAPKFKWLNTANSWVPWGLKRNWQRMGCISAVEPTPCPITLEEKKCNSSHLLQRDKSHQNTIFKLFKHHQLSPALHSTGNHEFWYSSRSRLVPNSLRTTGSNQNMLEIKKYGEKANGHVHSSPKGTQGVAPTAQTREEAALLMLKWLKECGLVEGS